MRLSAIGLMGQLVMRCGPWRPGVLSTWRCHLHAPLHVGRWTEACWVLRPAVLHADGSTRLGGLQLLSVPWQVPGASMPKPVPLPS